MCFLSKGDAGTVVHQLFQCILTATGPVVRIQCSDSGAGGWILPSTVYGQQYSSKHLTEHKADIKKKTNAVMYIPYFKV